MSQPTKINGYPAEPYALGRLKGAFRCAEIAPADIVRLPRDRQTATEYLDARIRFHKGPEWRGRTERLAR